MKKIGGIFFCLFLACGTFALYGNSAFAYSFSPPDGYTGSPADSYKTCIECHDTFELNGGNAGFSINTPGSFTPGEVLSITVSFRNSSTSKHGFELSALDASNNHVGTFSTVDGNTQTSNGNYIKHTLTGSSQSGNASWNVNWTAPSNAVSYPVTFYAAGNEANGDNSTDNDYIYTAQAEIGGTSATPTPAVSPTPEPTDSPTTTPVVTPTPVPTDSPTATPVVTPTLTPVTISAKVEIKPEVINQGSNGKFIAFIQLPSPYSIYDIETDTVECNGIKAVKGKAHKYRFIAIFKVKDFMSKIKSKKDRRVNKKFKKVKFTVSGELEDGTKFEGSDTVIIKVKKHDDDDDDDDDDNDCDDDEDEDEDERDEDDKDDDD